jgi:signal transduction histidine kinase
MGRGPKPDKGKAKPASSHTSAKHGDTRVLNLKKRLAEAEQREAEALKREAATSEVLRVIASSPTELQPVLDAMAESAARLCAAYDAVIWRLEGDSLRVVAHHGPVGQVATHVIPVLRGTVTGRTVLDRQTVQVTDLQAEVDEFPEGSAFARQFGHRSIVSVPLLREGVAIGVIALRRAEVQPFAEKQIDLLQTFADQAVIAIENVRLFNETKEALDRQTATSEILRVIASSPTDTQPVFDTILANAVQLCDAKLGQLCLRDGEDLRWAASHGATAALDELVRGTVYKAPAWALRPHGPWRPLQIPDLRETEPYRQGWPSWREQVDVEGARTVVAVPLVKGDRYLGSIFVYRREVRPFTNIQVELLRTFADQAVIAIENVRLFSELQEKNRALTQAHARVSESLEQQTATSEILQTIAQAQTDVQPVFDTIVRSAAQLCHANTTAVFLTDGHVLYHPANYGSSREVRTAIRANFPRPLDKETVSGAAILTRSIVQVPDIEEPSVTEFARRVGRGAGFRSMLSVPMLRQGEAVGAINVTRPEPGSFSDAEVALLQTFADQAVIAIENVRLFTELEAANRELAAASQHKSEFLANMSHELRTPLNAIIGFSEVLTDRMFGELNEKQEEYLKDIYASGTHLLSLINDILDLSKIEAGRMELELTDFDLPTALDNALMLVRERAQRRNLTLHKDVDAGLGQIRADERKIRQVVLNLLSNAIKFTPEGGRIEVAAVPRDGLVEVSVSDTGVGIAPEDQEAVFEDFRQVGTADKKAEGTGLGLTLCRKFIELHGGKIWVKSQPGAGSTFTFTIPLRQGE